MALDEYNLEGRVAIVTAGGEGIGKATALLLARHGARVIIAGRTARTLEETVTEIRSSSGAECKGIATDARDEDQVKRLVAGAIDTFGRIDILVNGVGWSGNAPLSRMETQAWKDDFQLNVDTAFLCSREVAKHFRVQESGAIVNVSSVAGVGGVKGMAAYSAAKSALQMLTRVAAAEWGPHGIRVNCVAPGLIATENAMKVYVANGMDVNQFCNAFPLRRPGTPEDVARAIVFLASDAASYITGETLAVNGGPVLGGAADDT
jgi:NAD(P)-dependent dehydrogenase (short-subunit alcohol dehydrogenase family)